MSTSLISRWGRYYRPELFAGTLDLPLAYDVPDAEQVIRALAVPTLITGRIMTLDDAETVLADGVADLVSMVRATIADPTLIAGRATGRRTTSAPVSGPTKAVSERRWPVSVSAASRETTIPFETPRDADRVKKVVIIGGGLAGLEAAKALAERGHDVELFEQSRQLGGQVALATRAPHRSDIGGIVAWLETESAFAGRQNPARRGTGSGCDRRGRARRGDRRDLVVADARRPSDLRADPDRRRGRG